MKGATAKEKNLELSELAAYAEEKYHIREEHKWAEAPMGL